MRPLGRLTIPTATAVICLITASTAAPNSNTIPATQATRYVTAIGPDNLKPASCAAITLTTLVTGNTGTNGNDLLLGSAAADTMNAAAGTDCVLAGGGNDSIDGGGGTDVCIGGPGTNTFTRCETQL